MAIIKSNSIINEIRGKLTKREQIVFSYRYDQIHAWEQRNPTGVPSEAQIAQRAKFAGVVSMVMIDMANPEKAAEWKQVAINSNGRWKTARGAAFASYMAQKD